MADVVANIGLGSALRGRGPDYSSTALRAYGTVGRYQKKEAPEKLINLDDFKLGTDNLYPVYAKQVGEVVKKAANDYVEIKNRVGDPVKARNIWEAQKAQYQEQINPLLSANSTLKKVSQTEGILFPNREKIMSAANDMNTTPQAWASLADMNNGLITTPQFGFDLPPIKEVNLSQVVDKYKGMTQERLGGVQYVPDAATGNRRAWQETITSPSQEAVDKAADDIMNNVDALQTFRYKYGDIIEKKYPDAKLISSTDAEEQHRATEALREAAKEMVGGKLGSVRKLHPYADNPPRETQADKNKKWEVEGNKVSNGQNVWHYDNDGQTEVFTFSKVNPADNSPMRFKGGPTEQETVVGVPVRFEKKKDGQPMLYVMTKEKITDESGKVTFNDTEVPVKYTPYNASKIENEYGKNPYQIRAIVSGSPEASTGTSSVKEQVVTATKKSSGETTSQRSASDQPKAYTRDELKKLSSKYTDDVIDAAVKAGKIVLKEEKKAKKAIKRNFTEEEIRNGTR